MESYITKEFLSNLGIELDETAYAALVDHFGKSLEQRIVEEVVNSLSPEQVNELSDKQSASPEELQTWLQANVPDLQDIIQDEVDILLGELAENADEIK